MINNKYLLLFDWNCAFLIVSVKNRRCDGHGSCCHYLYYFSASATSFCLANHPPYNESELLLQVAEGDETAFRQLFLHWNQLLAGYVLRITESKELTEEIVQDAFMKIWMVRETLTGINNFKHFLLVVARNQAFDALKKQLKEQERKRLWEKENKPELYIADNDPETSGLSLIEQAIDSLPPRRREVYLLSRHERLTYKEVAARLGISKESVKTHLKLATDSITAFIRSHLSEITIFAASLFKFF